LSISNKLDDGQSPKQEDFVR